MKGKAMDYVTHYREHGWVVVPEVFSCARVARVAEIAAQVSQTELAGNPATPMTADASPAGQLAPRKIDWAFPKHAEFRAFVLDGQLQSLISELIGHTAYLVRDQVFLKPARFGSANHGTRDQPAPAGHAP